MQRVAIETRGRARYSLLLIVGIMVVMGIATLMPFGSEASSLFAVKQSIFLGIGLLIAVGFSFVRPQIFSHPWVVRGLYIVALVLLVSVLLFGGTINGARSWFDLGVVSFQPADFAKLALVVVLSSYLDKNHIEISSWRHIITTGLLTLPVAGLILIQPDFGSAFVIVCIWLGMLLFSGLSRRQMLGFFVAGVSGLLVMWNFVFEPYQRARIMSFLDPLGDIQGAGYNAYQSIVAVGSGGVTGKGVGYGTQSRLQYLPEHETDFMFASFSEEWGFIGVMFLFGLYLLFIIQLLLIAQSSGSNFKRLIVFGFFCLVMSHFIVNVGMNIGLFPVSGVPLLFMSYGGSHMIISFLFLGIILAISRD